jgi:hypothetical protein
MLSVDELKEVDEDEEVDELVTRFEDEVDAAFEVINKGGRPVNRDRNSTIPVILSETSKDGYVAFKGILELYPSDIRERILNTAIPHNKIHDMSDFVRKMSQGAWAVSPMICRGELCPYRNRCELLMNNVAPIDAPCPFETYMIGMWAEKWTKALEVEDDNIVEINQVITIIICDLMLMRLRNALSLSPTGSIVYTPVGVDKMGNVILRTEAAPEVAMEKEYIRVKKQTFDGILATREAKAKHGIMDERDLAKSSAKTMFQAQQIMKKLEVSTKQMGNALIKDSPIAINVSYSDDEDKEEENDE